jgi:flavin reductase (DIM6/NTAB) family NADH-FMN oxidoreductase RutF
LKGSGSEFLKTPVFDRPDIAPFAKIAHIRPTMTMQTPNAPHPSPEAFRAAMRGFVGVVSLITVGRGAEATGLIATTGSSLSAEPPMVFVCVNRMSASFPILKAEGQFGWQALGAQHEPLAHRFSGRTGVRGVARYDGTDWLTMPSGLRLLADAPVAFDCAVEALIDRETHTIVLGRVRAIHTADGKGALLYAHGGYQSLP